MSALPVEKILPQIEHESFWFYVQNNASQGPFTHGQIEKLIEDKALGSNDFCWRQGFEEWRSLSATQEFATKFARESTTPLYPKIEIPSKLEIRVVNSLQKKEDNSRRRVVVQLAKAKKYYFSLYEWTIALLFSIGLAYFTCTFGLNEVRRKVLIRVLQSQMGQLQVVGEENAGAELSVEYLAPVLSAPGVADYPFPLSVNLSAYPKGETEGNNAFALGDYTVLSQEALLVEKEFSNHIDPVYRYPMRAHGQIFLSHPRDLLVNTPGSPLVFSH